MNPVSGPQTMYQSPIQRSGVPGAQQSGGECHAKMMGQIRKSVKNKTETRQSVRYLGEGLALFSKGTVFYTTTQK